MIEFEVLQLSFEAPLEALRNDGFRHLRTLLRYGSGLRFVNALAVCRDLLLVLDLVKDRLFVGPKGQPSAQFLRFIR